MKNFRGGSRGIPNAEETATPALIRPGLRPAHLPPQGKAIGKACMAYVEKYHSNHPNIAKHVGFPLGVELSGGQFG